MESLPFPLLADQFAPRCEFSRTDHLVVEADPASTYRAVHDLDLTDLHGFLVTAAVRLRELPEHWREDRAPRQRTRLRIHDLDAGTDWVVLGENPGHEIVFGAIGKVWQPVVKWVHVEARDFMDFTEPGYASPVRTRRAAPTTTSPRWSCRCAATDEPSVRPRASRPDPATT
ncbi:hypothetical protein [Lentzea flaviverrucosa]|uniref:Uncharacterized protein n=1 Tax=Lentzea flaviverrucosa TaxID=200379 RepID=A0A1H9XWG0_9PSEU|nr:hypothetical protein [Lentzea flaviverrucosa]RDI34329.1 hypothetical protein DFR72_10176 [Lentzea flaviverrucosa]SES50500.1 hypothetical protein SAMN05216195_120131 [Lentzea flaviverrucosa]